MTLELIWDKAWDPLDEPIHPGDYV